MALHNNSNLYTGGATVVNTSPYTNFAINMDAKRKAKEEALDQYYRSLDKQVNPAGMRTQDIPALMENENARREYYRQNRGAIMNPRLDGGRAQTEFQNMFQGSLGTVQKSKSLGDNYKALAPILADPEKRSRMPRSVMNQLHLNDLPINDAGHVDFNLSSLQYDPKPLDQDKLVKSFADIKPDKTPTIVATDGKSMTRTIRNTYSYNDAAKEQIYNRSNNLLNTDASFEATIDKIWDNIKQNGDKDSPDYQTYNKVFQKHFNRPMSSEEDLAAAYNMGMLQSQRQEDEIKDDAFGQKKAMAYLNDGLIKGRMKIADEYARGRIDYKNQTTAAAQDGVLNKFINSQIEEGKSDFGKKSGIKDKNGSPTAVVSVAMNGQKFEGTEVRMPKFVTDKLSVYGGKDDKGNEKWEEPETYLISKDKKYIIPVFPLKDDKGNIKHNSGGNMQVDPSKSKPILMEDYKGMLGKEWLSKNQVGDEVVDDFSDGNEDAPQAPISTTTSTRTTERRKTQRLAKPTKPLELD
jgi:hypothetical protein